MDLIRDCLGFRVSAAQRRVDRLFSRAFRPLGISFAHGQILMTLVEAVKRGPLSMRTREFVQQVGLLLLVALMGFAFWNDVSRYWSSFFEWMRGL